MANDLTIGTLLESRERRTRAPPRVKLNRHTFWCGQSGSGKTYALGVALEQILLHTRLPLVILDPNSDFVRLGELRRMRPRRRPPSSPTRDIRVRRSTAGDGRAAARAVPVDAAALAGRDPADRPAPGRR